MKCLLLMVCLSPLLLPLYMGAATEPTGDQEVAVQFTNERTVRWQFGVIIRARGATTGITATLPFPMSWPEQEVTIVDEQISSNVRPVRFRVLENGVKQAIVTVPKLAAGEEASALWTVEVVKRDIVAPNATGPLRRPAKSSAELRSYLAPSPYIESNDPEIRDAVGPVIAEKTQDWEKAEAIFDWVRGKVEYRFDRQIKGARQALDDGFGDCEELTSLFVAMCRVAGIPARSVWVPGHCYPEFYLEDEQGKGHWYPCQAAGTRIFGAMPEARPVLQKGDNFRIPGSRQPQRYVQETMTAKNAEADPEVQFVQKQLE